MTEREGFVYDYGDTRYRTEMQYSCTKRTKSRGPFRGLGTGKGNRRVERSLFVHFTTSIGW